MHRRSRDLSRHVASHEDRFAVHRFGGRIGVAISAYSTLMLVPAGNLLRAVVAESWSGPDPTRLRFPTGMLRLAYEQNLRPCPSRVK
jgi:hypothetical protein